MEYPGHRFRPEDLLTFVEMEDFAQDWQDLGLNDDALMALQVLIMIRPKGNPVVSGTGGLRKIRFSPRGSGRGKRGAFRIGYVYFEEFGIVLLVVAYGKNDSDDIPAAHRKLIRAEIQEQKREFSRKFFRS